MNQFKIKQKDIEKLQILNEFKIVYILDDSFTMRKNKKTMSRWEELHEFLKLSLEIIAPFNTNGVDVYFLNRLEQGCVQKIKSIDQLDKLFDKLPSGGTPLTKTIQNAINDNTLDKLINKKLLLIIATDGEPTDADGAPSIEEFKKCLFNRPDYVYITIRACTDDKESIGYLNDLDKNLKRLDVVDDYENETIEVKDKGNDLNYRDYILKTLLGSILPEFDNLDE